MKGWVTQGAKSEQFNFYDVFSIILTTNGFSHLENAKEDKFIAENFNVLGAWQISVLGAGEKTRQNFDHLSLVLPPENIDLVKVIS